MGNLIFIFAVTFTLQNPNSEHEKQKVDVPPNSFEYHWQSEAQISTWQKRDVRRLGEDRSLYY